MAPAPHAAGVRVRVHNRLARAVLLSISPAGASGGSGGGGELQLTLDAAQHAFFERPEACELRVQQAAGEQATAAPLHLSLAPPTRTLQVRAARRAFRLQGGDETLRWQPSTPSAASAFLSALSEPDSAGVLHLLLYPTRDSRTFLASLPDGALLSSLSLPGTHESLAMHGWPVSQCQSAALTAQLNAGVRFLDIRLALKVDQGEERLLAFHGPTEQFRELGEVLVELYAWLDGTGKRETVIVSLKPEGSLSDPWATVLYARHVDPNRQRWWLENRVPSLGECRGKLVLFSRFVPLPDKPAGINSTKWPDSFDGCFSYPLPSGQLVATQDWYKIGLLAAIPHKMDLVQQLLAAYGSRSDVLSLCFLSASSFPLALPPFAALGMFKNGPACLRVVGLNDRLFDLVASRLSAAGASLASASGTSSENLPAFESGASPQSVAPGQASALSGLGSVYALDFCERTPDLLPLLIEANFAPGS